MLIGSPDLQSTSLKLKLKLQLPQVLQSATYDLDAAGLTSSIIWLHTTSETPSAISLASAEAGNLLAT